MSGTLCACRVLIVQVCVCRGGGAHLLVCVSPSKRLHHHRECCFNVYLTPSTIPITTIIPTAIATAIATASWSLGDSLRLPPPSSLCDRSALNGVTLHSRTPLVPPMRLQSTGGGDTQRHGLAKHLSSPWCCWQQPAAPQVRTTDNL